ncbi:MAG: hypothetical protein HYZ43_02155 [Flavobacteriia bacterium]|nr:hypothetical protein [Flavobacteriia bacterium]
MKWFSVCVLGLIFMLSVACSGKKTEYIAALDQLKRTSDSVDFDLDHIAIEEVKTLSEQSFEHLSQLKMAITNDTLDLEFARMLEGYSLAHYDLETLEMEIKVCKMQNELEAKRMLLLKQDVESDAGDRAEYDKNIRFETRELTKIRNHSIELKRRFEKAKSAIEQFQPEIERYLTQNVPSTP